MNYNFPLCSKWVKQSVSISRVQNGFDMWNGKWNYVRYVGALHLRNEIK